MKTLAFLTACALAFLGVSATSGKGKVGYCDDDSDCATNFYCVSVQTTRSNVEDVKQCLPGPTAANNYTNVCGGTIPGLCPSFSTTWGEDFREISSVCAYIIPTTKTAKCIEKGAANSSKNVIECYFVQDPDDPTNSSAKIGVIYGCVDFDGSRLLFKTGDKSDKIQYELNYTEIVNDKCVNPKNPSGSSFVCSSQGTCASTSQNAFGTNGTNDYSCKCNVGFSGKYCQTIEDNRCYNDGVCGGGSCNLTTLECSNCKAGTTGDKCAQCVPTATNVCSGHGKCVQTSGTVSTLGVTNSSSSSGSSSASTSSSGSSSTSTTSSSSSDSDVAKVVAAVYRRLSDSNSTKVFQCQCDDGYSDVHCGVKVSTKKSSSNSSSSSNSTTTSLASPSISMSLGAVVATLLALLAL